MRSSILIAGLACFLGSAALPQEPDRALLKCLEDLAELGDPLFLVSLERLRMGVEDYHALVERMVQVELLELPKSKLGFDPAFGLRPLRSQQQAAWFRNVFHKSVNRRLAERFPTPLASHYEEVLVVVHQSDELGKKTLQAIQAGKLKGIQPIVLLDSEFPLPDPGFLEFRPVLLTSSHGEIPEVKTRKATLVGGFFEACLARSAADIILNSLGHEGLVEIIIRPELVYGRGETYSLRFKQVLYESLDEAAGFVSSGNLTAQIDSFLDLLLNPRYKHLNQDHYDFVLEGQEKPADPRDFGHVFYLRRKSDNKRAVIRIAQPVPPATF